MTNWFVLRCATRQEKRAHDALTEAGFTAYLPLITRWVRIGARKMLDKRQSAYLDGYLFAQIPDGHFATVEATEGVHRVLRYTNASGLKSPRAVPDGLVEAIRQAEDRGDFDKTRRENPVLALGTRVRVVAGPFEHLVGAITAERGQQRVKVLMDAIQRGAPVKPVVIDLDKLEAVA